jgi:hypothetical protein
MECEKDALVTARQPATDLRGGPSQPRCVQSGEQFREIPFETSPKTVALDRHRLAADRARFFASAELQSAKQ